MATLKKVSFVGEPDGIPPDPSLGGACSLDPEVRGYCEGSYSVFLLAFLVLQLFLSSIPLNALKNVQMLMGGISLTSMLAMFVTCVIAIDEDLGFVRKWLLAMFVTCLIAIDEDQGPDAGADMLPPTNMSSFGKLVTAALFSQICHQAFVGKLVTAEDLFSQICHQGVSTIIGVMRDKRQAKSGPRTASIVTLNWEDYTGGAVNGTQRAWWATVISTAVLTFPVITRAP
ncbi:hypothetical protein T484DRAFT_1847034 [Baffinella frigidus]|nr:hypothetical protein T484DRAFT_1847034 [Cryptophyta sp. CCMP2293]